MLTDENIKTALDGISKTNAEEVFNSPGSMIILDYDECGYTYFRAVKNVRSFQLYADRNGAIIVTRSAFKQMLKESKTTNEHLNLFL